MTEAFTYFEWLCWQWEGGITPLDATIEKIRSTDILVLLARGTLVDGSFVAVPEVTK